MLGLVQTYRRGLGSRLFQYVKSIERSFTDPTHLARTHSTSTIALSRNEASLAKGKIELICGPMFSGKTTELIRRVQRQKRADKSAIVIKHLSDQRYQQSKSDQVSKSDDNASKHTSASSSTPTQTPSGNSSTSLPHEVSWCEAVTHDAWRIPALATHKLESAIMHPQVQSAQVVGIDEGQFFPDLAEGANTLAKQGKLVIVAALDGTFRQEPFPSTSQLFPLCERIDKLHAVCRGCGDDASFSIRLTSDEEVHVIGGEDMYQAMCRSCAQKHNKHTQGLGGVDKAKV